MRESTSARGPLPRATGIFDSLSGGFGVVNERPWIILIPVLLDLFFLFGPRLSIAPLVSQFVAMPQVAQAVGADTTAPLIAFAEETNLLSLLSTGGLLLPTIVPLLQGAMPEIARGNLTLVESIDAFLTIAIAAMLLGALIGVTYRTILAQQARDGEVTALQVPIESLVAWFRIVLLVAIVVIGGLVLVIVPLAFVSALASQVVAAAPSVMTAVAMTFGLAAQLYLFFTSDAIVYSRVGPIQAIRRSVAVVQVGVWSALMLVLLLHVITIASSQFWLLVASQASWGLALGIVGNAYIASGLVAASMLFYRERMEILLAQRS